MPPREHSVASHLRAAVMNQRIYPSGSPMVERAVGLILQTAEAALRETDRLSIVDRQGRVFANGKEAADAEALSQVFTEHGIQSLTFVPGVTREEVARLVGLLSRKKPEDKKFTELLEAEGLEHVKADKVNVVEVEEGDVVAREMDLLFSQVRDFPQLVGSLRRAYDLLEEEKDPARRAQAQTRLTTRLSEMSPSLLRDLFENPLPQRIEESNLRADVMKSMAHDKFQDIFGEIGQWYDQIRSRSSSEFEAMEQLNKLKGFLGKLLTAPQSRKVPFALYEELLKQGLIDDIPPEVEKNPEEDPLPVQVDRLMEGPASALVESPGRDKLPEIVSKLCGVGLFDLCQKLLGKFMENFQESAALVRQVAVKTSRGLLETLWSSRRQALGESLFSGLRRLADQERSWEVYKDLAEVLAMAAISFILDSRLKEALDVLQLLRRHQDEPFPFMPRRAGTAREALANAARGGMDVLTADMLAEDAAKREAAREVLSVLGAAAAGCYVDLIKKSPDPRLRRMAAGSLKAVGEEGHDQLLAAFHLGSDTPGLLNLLSVMDGLPGAKVAGAIQALMHYPDAFLRMRMVQALGRTNDPAAQELLGRFLDDKEETVQMEAVRAAGETRAQAAVPRLAGMLAEGSTLKREEVCLALGKIADARAVPALTQALSGRGGLFKKGGTEESVRVRAAWALTQIQDPAALQALRDHRDDENQQIQLMARQRSS